jgi:aspartyl-tRNA(Asn)/glutamyl-tRNA(Gln) amidotransferase subunit A
MDEWVRDPLGEMSLSEYGARLRSGEISAEAITRAYLARIRRLNDTVKAYVHVAEESALQAAAGIDRLIAGGVDLGPLMGVPTAIKDLLTVTGMPVRAGSRVDVSDLAEPEGPFVRRLKAAGCILLGKTRTIEFAAGMQNVSHPTPWNPRDLQVHRATAGSSNGSAAALAAGMCALAVGTDTGGSVRAPAAFCGVFGLKTGVGRWPIDGLFKLCPRLDTIGLFTRTAGDAALAYAAIEGIETPPAIPPRRLLVGIPENHFLEDTDPFIAAAFSGALDRLKGAGLQTTPLFIPDVESFKETFGLRLAADLMATLGTDRFKMHRDRFDPVLVDRISPALSLTAVDYLHITRKQEATAQAAKEWMAGLSGFVAPTVRFPPPPVSTLTTTEAAVAFNARATMNTRPGNQFDLCGVSIPIPGPDGSPPAGLQLMCRNGREAELLSMAQGMEAILGVPESPDMGKWIDQDLR